MNLNKIYELANLAEKIPPYTNDGMFPPSKYYRFLHNLVVEKKPNLSVVLGVCGGGCCYNLLKGESGLVVGIDVANEYQRNIEFLNQNDRFSFWRGDSIAMAGEINALYGEVDLLFIDTIHTFDRTIKEFEAWYPYMARDCVVLLDDLFRNGMEEAWQHLIKFGTGLRLDNLHIGGSPTDGGFGIICNIRKKTNG